MSHPTRPELNIVSTISSAIAMDQPPPTSHDTHGHASPLTPAHDSQHGSAVGNGVRKRKKSVVENAEMAGTSEPRRLRRSHEACARCRSKKIKCDSKLPRCTACETAGVQCNQEDRHRKTLTPRGHAEKIERQLVQCQALLRKFIPNFALPDIDIHLVQHNIVIEPSEEQLAEAFHMRRQGGPNSPFHDEGPIDAKAYPYPHMMHPPYPMTVAGYPPHPPGAPSGAPYPHMGLPPGMYDPRLIPAFPHPSVVHLAAQPAQPPQLLRPAEDIKGQDPKANDLSSPQAMAKCFGVSQDIVSEAKIGIVPANVADEDLDVGSSGLLSGRDRDLTETKPPRDPKYWQSIRMQRMIGGEQRVENIQVWLPKDRHTALNIVQIYFAKLNVHRPVLVKHDFIRDLNALYDEHLVHYDPGLIFNIYLVLALGTMSEVNRTAGNHFEIPPNTQPEKIVAPGWPHHEDFFKHALPVKSDLRMTISSLQALILLHWYLYTERQQRSLWRLVGSMVRVAVELGLHHDPFKQRIFSDPEAQLRVRLWSICMIHDRGTSVLLGRPLAISPADSDTPEPFSGRGSEFSEHFFYSAPVAGIQADIVNALYSPQINNKNNQEAIMRNATRIIKQMLAYRETLPETYKHFFEGTENWPLEKKRELVDNITEDQGLTLLKIGIARILLLRALFSSNDISFDQKMRALTDAIVVSHNIIAIHHTLIRFPDIAFFTSPIPLHIAAMVILYGQMSNCQRISREMAIEDIWYALDMLPRFRWRWERRDMNGGHPLLEKLSEKVLNINLAEVKASGTPVLIPEEDWEASSPTAGPMSPTPSRLSSNQARASYGPYVQQTDSNGNKILAEVPAGWFWPMDPQNPAPLPVGEHKNPHDHTQSLNPPIGTIGCDPAPDNFMLEEKDPKVEKSHMEPYIQRIADWRHYQSYPSHQAGPSTHG